MNRAPQWNEANSLIVAEVWTNHNFGGKLGEWFEQSDEVPSSNLEALHRVLSPTAELLYEDSELLEVAYITDDDIRETFVVHKQKLRMWHEDAYFRGHWNPRALREFADALDTDYKAGAYDYARLDEMGPRPERLTVVEWMIMANCGDKYVHLLFENSNFLVVLSCDTGITTLEVVDRKSRKIVAHHEL